MESLLQDIRFGFRTLTANRGFTVVATVTLALGIGANIAMFSIINGVLLRPPDYPDSNELVMIKRFDLTEQSAGSVTTPGNFYAWQERTVSFAAMAALNGDVAALTGDGSAHRLGGIRSAGSLLQTLATPPFLGRALTVADDDADNPVVVLSYRLWQQLFAGDPAALGRAIVLDGIPCTIVGVMPEDFGFAYFNTLDVDFWRPSGWTPEYKQNHGNYAHEVIARLAPGVSLEEAQREMDVVATQLRDEYPEANRDHGILLVPLHEDLVAGVDSLLTMLMGAVGMVLLIGTVNLANLQLARAGAREREVAVRKAIGATPARLARQMLTESVLLSTLGGIAALALAYALTDVTKALIPANVPGLDRVSIDAPVLLFTVSAAAAVGIVFGLFPAWRSSRQPAGQAIGQRAGSSRRATWLWDALVVAEVSLSVVLLVGAGLLLRTFVNLTSVEPGYRTDNVMTLTVSAPGTYEPRRRLDLWERIRAELEDLPGVASAAAANQLPAEPNRVSGWFNFIDRPLDNSDRSFLVPYRLVSPGYFQTLGIALTQGRAFAERDQADAPTVIVNEAAVERFWGDRPPIGDRIGIGSSDGELFLPAATVIGVVADVHNDGLAADARPAMYYPVRFAGGRENLTFAMHTIAEPTGVLRAARERIRRLEPAAPVFAELTMSQVLDAQVAPTRSVLQLIGTFAALGLAMAAIGVFGVLSHSVSQRAHEIGIRTALGADSRALISMVVGQAMAKALVGTSLGVVGAVAMSGLMSDLLYDVSPADPATIVGVSLLLGLTALVASFLPARRAARVHPVEALRSS